MDCSLKVYEVFYGPNPIGIMQSFEMNNETAPIYQIGNTQPIVAEVEAPTLKMRMLMTRDQKVMFAVMYRLMGKVDFSMEVYGQGRYTINGRLDISRELLKEFAERKHSDNEVEFIVENASLELIKEKKHGKSKARIY
jgi:hypothetical protein